MFEIILVIDKGLDGKRALGYEGSRYWALNSNRGKVNAI